MSCHEHTFDLRIIIIIFWILTLSRQKWHLLRNQEALDKFFPNALNRSVINNFFFFAFNK